MEFLQKQYDEIEETLVQRGQKSLAVTDTEFFITRKAIRSHLISSIGRILDESKATNLIKLSTSKDIKFSSEIKKRLAVVQANYREHIKPWRDKIISHIDRAETPKSVAKKAALSRQHVEDVVLSLIDVYDELGKENSLTPIYRYPPNEINLPRMLFEN